MSFVPVYILILGFTIIVDYFAGILIGQADNEKRKAYLIASLVANIGVLSVFKYYNFFNENLTAFLGGFNLINTLPYLSILLPIGLSFHTFQAMSYTIEVYRGKQKPERHFGIYALYVMFYPQLVAGPIERPQNLLYQFREKHDFDYERITDGLKLMAWGLFKKIVIADRLSVFVDEVYDHPFSHHGSSLIMATIFFSFQIFCDFSAYSDIAIGSARVMGFDLMKNFNSPYHSKNVQEFWTRWHISLSTWFKDYVYIPLGGNRVTLQRWCFNIMVVFLLSGLWHGANWTFIIWGALHFFYIVFAILTKKIREKLSNLLGLTKVPEFNSVLQVVTTFSLVTFAWIFFRAKTVAVAVYIIRESVTGLYQDLRNLFSHLAFHLDAKIDHLQFFIAICSILLLEGVHYLQQGKSIAQSIKTKPFYIRWAVYYVFLILIVFFCVSSNRQFIYFQF